MLNSVFFFLNEYSGYSETYTCVISVPRSDLLSRSTWCWCADMEVLVAAEHRALGPAAAHTPFITPVTINRVNRKKKTHTMLLKKRETHTFRRSDVAFHLPELWGGSRPRPMSQHALLIISCLVYSVFSLRSSAVLWVQITLKNPTGGTCPRATFLFFSLNMPAWICSMLICIIPLWRCLMSPVIICLLLQGIFFLELESFIILFQNENQASGLQKQCLTFLFDSTVML